MIDANCPRCGRLCRAAYACKECAASAREHLQGIAYLSRHLGAKRAHVGTTWIEPTISEVRQVKWRTDDGQSHTHYGLARNTPTGVETGTTYDPRVTAVERRVGNHLLRIVKVIQENIHDGYPARNTIAGMAAFIAKHTGKLRLLESAPEDFRDIERAHTALEDLLDSPPAQLYLGLCYEGDCTQALYVDAPAPGRSMAEYVRCRRCGTQHETKQRREQLMEGVNDYHGTAKEISRLLRLIGGADVSVKMIYSYAAHGLITQVGTRVEFDKMGRKRDAALYSIGAVRVAVEEMRDKRERQKEARRKTAC